MIKNLLNTILCFFLVLSSPDLFANDGPSDETQATEALDLSMLLKAAMSQDGRVLAAHAQLDVYRAKYKEAQWLWFPAAKLDMLFGGPVGERRLACSDRPDCVELKNPTPWNFGDLGGVISFAVGGRIEAAMPLYTFGKLTEAKNAARAGMKAAQAGIEQARQAVALEVRRAYYGWLLSIHAVEILTDGEKKLKAAEEKLIKMLDELSMEVTDRDLFKLRYHATQIIALKTQTEQNQQIVLSALEFLTGLRGLGTKLQLKEIPLLAPSGEELKPLEVHLNQAEENRPELRRLEAAREALVANVEIQKANFYPDLFLAGYIGGSYSPAHDLIKNTLLNRGFTYYDAGLSLGLRITLDIPQKTARLEKARAELSTLDAQAQQAHQALRLEIDKRIKDLKSLDSSLKIFKKGHRAAKAWMRTNLMSYGIGISDTKDLLDSLAANAQSKLNLYKVQYDLLVAKDAFKASLGADLTK